MSIQTQWDQFQTEVFGRLHHGGQSQLEQHVPLWQRLLILIDANASGCDILAGYRDALASATVLGIDSVSLPALHPFAFELLARFGLQQQPASMEICLAELIEPGLTAVFQHQLRRKVLQVPFDATLQRRLNAPEYQHYNGTGQATAVRAVLKAPIDAALLVNLPTGCGKTLLIDAQVAITPKDQLVVVIVPTVALALDQAERMRATLAKMGEDHGGDYAWHSDLSADAKEGIRQRLIQGQQRVLFSSPEAATSSLTVRLFELAQQQRLAAMVIDEAHILAHWGAEFRPEFQLMPALLQALQNSSTKPIRHILMSATLTQATIDLLQTLLPTKQPVIEVNGSFLRPEIDYVIEQADSQRQHQTRVSQLLKQLPRPLILYTTKVEDANQWFEHLRQLGFERIGLFTGKTNKSERLRLMDDWRKNRCDLMVATSAFGVGIDKSDVRSVVHAAIPENLDRYYQECGRGGRDGHACRAHLVYYFEQMNAAKALSSKRRIGREKGFARWLAMFQRGKPSDVAEIAVSIDTVPPHGTSSNESNTDWNWRTLLLMQRSGLLTIRFAQPHTPERQPGEDDIHYNVRIEHYYAQYFRTVHVDLNSGHSNESEWWARISPQRDEEKRADRDDFKAMAAAINTPDFSMCRLLQRHYQTSTGLPQRSCGGCPGCRASGRISRKRQLGQHVWCSYRNSGGTALALHYPQHSDLRGLLHTLRPRLHAWLSSGEVQAIRTDRETQAVLQKLFQSSGLVWIDLDLDASNPHWNELVLLSPSAETMIRPDPLGPNTILIAPAELADLDSPYRTWAEHHQHAMPLDQFLKR